MGFILAFRHRGWAKTVRDTGDGNECVASCVSRLLALITKPIQDAARWKECQQRLTQLVYGRVTSTTRNRRQTTCNRVRDGIG